MRINKKFNKVKELQQALARAQDEINFLKTHDFLTKLFNFTTFQELANQAIENQKIQNAALILFGIDNFKIINERLGVIAGDYILIELANRIKAFCNSNVLCARKFDDQFIIFLKTNSLKQLTKEIKKITKIVSAPFYIENEEIVLTVSTGISRYPNDAKNIKNLLQHANFALNTVKQNGKNDLQFFNYKIASKSRFLHRVQKELSYALAKNEFFIEYQPQININNWEIVGFEALLRWSNKKLGMVAPTDFIPLMEESGQIITVGNWVLLEACNKAKQWSQIQKNLSVSVNVSINQLLFKNSNNKNQIIAHVKKMIEHSADDFNLELEITENIFINEDSHVIKNLKKLKKMNVRLSCDDFGMGYASFSRLKILPLDTIKLDQSLIQSCIHSNIDYEIIKCLVKIAKLLNVKIIAEGVETIEQINILKKLGCNLIQGHYFSKSLSAQAFEKLLKKVNKA